MDENNSKPKSPRRLLKYAIILGFLALLAAIAIPNYSEDHGTSPMNVCINNLRQIDAAKQQWGLENNKTNMNTVVNWNDVRPYLGRGATGSLDSIYCPDDKTKKASNSYTLGDLGLPPKCKKAPATHRIN